MKLLACFLISFCFSLSAFAQDVISATSEDLKEFDQMLAKKKLEAPPKDPGAAGKDRRAEDPRHKFNDGPARRGDAGGPPGGPRPPTEPGANPGPGAVAPPPPPPPPPRDGGGQPPGH